MKAKEKEAALHDQRLLLWYLDLQLLWIEELDREPPDWATLQALNRSLRRFERNWGGSLPGPKPRRRSSKKPQNKQEEESE